MVAVSVYSEAISLVDRHHDSWVGRQTPAAGIFSQRPCAIHITLARCFWSWGTDEDIIARLVKEDAVRGVFAYLHRQLE